MGLNLITINKRLEELVPLIANELKEFAVIEVKYQTRYSQLVRQSGLGYQAGREAEAKEILQVEGLADKYMDKKYLIRSLFAEKDILIEISRNIRSLGGEYK